MNNRIQLTAAVDAIYALSSLKAIDGNPSLPGPFGRNEEAALTALARRHFHELCGELGLTPDSDDSVDLESDCHELLQAIVTDRTIAGLCGRTPQRELVSRLKCRLRRAPARRGSGRY